MWFCWFFVCLFKSLEHKADNAKENVLLTERCSEAGFQMAEVTSGAAGEAHLVTQS